jgi:hypothetical protein
MLAMGEEGFHTYGECEKILQAIGHPILILDPQHCPGRDGPNSGREIGSGK